MVDVQPIQKKIIGRLLKKYVSKLPEDAIVLDIGCGLGDSLKIVSKQRKVIGLEINPDIAKIANFTIKNPLFHGVVVYDGTNFPFKDRMFNMVYLIEVIEHVEDDEKFLSECFRVLKNGGYLILTTPNREKEPLNPNIHHGHVRHYTKEEISNKLMSVGFTIDKVYWRFHPLCSFLDFILTQVGRKFLKKDSYLGHNVSIYQPKTKISTLILSIYKLIIDPILTFLVLLEFEILKIKNTGKNMIIIARKV